MNPIRTLLSLAGLAALAVAAHGQYTPVDLSAQLNSDATAYTGGGNYQAGGTTLNVVGVPFSLGSYPSGSGHLGTILSPTSGTNVYDFPGLSIVGASTLFTLINSGYGGSAGTNQGMVEVFGTNGAHATLSLTEGFNIRDHYQGQYVNGLTDPTVVPTYFNNGVSSNVAGFGPDRLDRQTLTLGPSFVGQTVTELKFTALGHGAPDGAPFLAAATFAPQAVPEPATLAALGLGAVGVLRRRKRA